MQRRQVILSVKNAGTWRYAPHAKHWHHFSEIWWSIYVKVNSIPFNEARIFIVNMFYWGRMAFVAF